VLRILEKFPGVVKKSAENYSPNLICNYLFELSQSFNSFYEASPVLKAEKEQKAFRLTLTEGVAQVIENGLKLLGIKVTEEM